MTVELDLIRARDRWERLTGKLAEYRKAGKECQMLTVVERFALKDLIRARAAAREAGLPIF